MEEQAMKESRTIMRFDSSVEDMCGDAMHINFDMSVATMVDRLLFMHNPKNEFDRCKWEQVGEQVKI